ncbi:MAG: hypothetical protein A2V70_06040, partial [Planctomycetes bacterium RBG_13_63_9]
MGQPESSLVEAPPRTISGILRRLGPGLIIAGSIVGSGELIATTKTGAQAGFWLLWLIIIGCVIKLFAQVEFGRHAISSGKTTMAALDEVPGPRLRVNWLLWYWLVMFLVSLAQLGGIVGGVGQSLAMSVPISGDFNDLLQEQKTWDEKARSICQGLPEAKLASLSSRDAETREATQALVRQQLVDKIGCARPGRTTWDDVYWSAIVTVVTVALLAGGRYGVVQNLSMVLVASFTAVTVFAVLALQLHAAYAIRWEELWQGLSFRLPDRQQMTHSPLALVQGIARSPLATALATFGIIGVGATELIAYPYWCLEKGYARFTGPREGTAEWAQRAQGWMRVMRWDASISMVVFTFATVAFYLLGA